MLEVNLFSVKIETAERNVKIPASCWLKIGFCASQEKSSQFEGKKSVQITICIGFNLVHWELFPCLIFAQRRINDQKIEQKYEHFFVLIHVLAKSIKIHLAFAKH